MVLIREAYSYRIRKENDLNNETSQDRTEEFLTKRN